MPFPPLPGAALSLAAAAMVAGCAATPAPRGTTHTYYVAADEVDWDYAPGGMNIITGMPIDSAKLKSGRKVQDTKYHKAVYHEYTDSTFTTRKPRPPEWEHLGILGPVLRAEVGDTIQVVYRNNASHPSGLHPHGVFYDKDSEGAPYEDGTSGADKADDAVPPGGTHTYVWPVPERAGPGPGDPNSIIWMYHSHTAEAEDVFTGLMGPMIVSAPGTTKPDGTPKGVDRELVVAFYQMREDLSWFAKDNMPYLFAGDGPDIPPNRFTPFFDRYSINGYTHGNLPVSTMTVKKGERVRWYVFSTTGDFDFHTPHWHGNTVLMHGMRTDVVAVMPMEMVIADMVPDNPGTWLFHCHVSEHLIAGMQARYAVTDEPEVATR